METIPNEGLPRIAYREPVTVQVEAGKVYSWCTCGLTLKTPFCDSEHKKIEGLPYKSIKVQFDQAAAVEFCQCKQTRTPPFCDCSHKGITDKP